MYLLLLLIAIGLMIGLRQCSARNLPERSEKVAGGDTINVAIEISPMGSPPWATPWEVIITT